MPVPAPAPVHIPAPIAPPTPTVAELEAELELSNNLQAQATLASIEEPEPEPEFVPEPKRAPVPEPVEEIEYIDEEIEEEVEVEKPKGPLSYLAMAKGGAKSTVTVKRIVRRAVVKGSAPAATPAAVSKPTEAHAAVNGKPARPAAAAKPAPAATGRNGPSVYVRGLPPASTQAELSELVVAAFGAAIKHVEVISDKSIAFIDVDSEATLRAVLDKAASEPFVIRGSTLKMEERRPKPVGPRPTGDRKDRDPKRTASGGDNPNRRPAEGAAGDRKGHNSGPDGRKTGGFGAKTDSARPARATTQG